MMKKFDEQALLKKYREGKCTEEELCYIEAWYADWQMKDRAVLSEADLNKAEAAMREAVMLRVGAKRYTLRPWKAVAAIAAMVLGIWFYTSRHLEGSKATRDLYVNDIAPGSNRATLTLPNGKVISLSEVKTGLVIDKNSLTYNDGTIVNNSPLPDAENVQNGEGNSMMLTASTPKGGTYQVVLPDGTQVWLNADSKISFPVRFSGGIRKILLKGEAYFKVSKDKAMPFIVQTDQQEVTVLGTQFNINSYADEGSVKTTLLEGSVKISSLLAKPGVHKDQGSKTLKPGQQAVLTRGQFNITTTNPDEAIAWKEGYFRFYEVDLQTFMNTIARWYDIEVDYEGGIDQFKELAFGGSVSRSKNISEVLKILAQTGKVHYKITGKKVTITR